MDRTLKTSLLFACAAGSVILIGGYLWLDEWWTEHHPPPPHPPPPQAMHMLARPVTRVGPGVRKPRIVPAARADLTEESEVIGVDAAGKHRAYPLSAFERPAWQLVNDLVGDVPVTVTYSFQGKFCRVFSSAERRAPLDMSLAPGFQTGDILLGVGQFFYSQRSLKSRDNRAPPFPYPELKATETIWKDWKKRHPDTDVYVGPQQTD
jgi:Protein of unknown function (DUF3179)